MKNSKNNSEVLTEKELPKSARRSQVRFKERVEHLQTRKGLSEADAREVVTTVIQEKEGWKVGQLIQYNDQGLRAGYIAQVPQNGAVLIQPIGAKGSTLPQKVKVKLENVVAVIEGKFIEEDNNMAKAKATTEAMKAAKPAKPAKEPKAPKVKAAKAEAINGAGRTPKTVRLLKSPAEGELKGQALVIVETLKAGGKKGMTVPDLIAGLEGKIQTANVLGLKDVWAMNRKKLIDNGFVEEVAA